MTEPNALTAVSPSCAGPRPTQREKAPQSSRIGRQPALTGVLGRIEISSVQRGTAFAQVLVGCRSARASHRQVDVFRTFVQRNDFGALLIALVVRARLRPLDQAIDGCRQPL